MQRMLAALLAGMMSTASNAQSLRDAVEGAWSRLPSARALAARVDAFDARKNAAGALFPGPPSVGFGHRSDRADHRGATEWEGEITVPVWTPGSRDRALALAEADHARFGAETTRARWLIAGEVRERFWEARLASNEREVAARKLAEATVLAEDVARRVKAGDLAQVDANQAEALVKLAAGALVAADTRLAQAVRQFALLSGFATLPSEQESSSQEPPRPDAHPQLAADARAVAAALARLDQARTVTRDPPEVAFGVRAERAAATDRYDPSVRIGIRIPFGTDARNRTRIAEANADFVEAGATLEVARRGVESEIAAARAALNATRTIEALADERFRLASANQALFEQAFRFGHVDLPTRLRAENERFEAELALARARAEIGRAASRYNQSIGLLP